ncbi:MAG TPA: EF-P lysine aminoacylase EpmA [Burkholderiales bacterium]|nr:EF-P lysine aminoacylase EpmA [Burkholderiales bacterium]
MNTSRGPESGWRPSAALDVLKLRARMRERLRAFFSARGVLEVDTPALSTAATTDLHLQSFSCRSVGLGTQTLYLHTSPEFPMKRLLAAGSGSIYQICNVFRDGEAGRLHNPEFTMLEWYRVGFDYHQLMDETAALIVDALAGSRTLEAPEKLTYAHAFERHCGINPHTANSAVLAAIVKSKAIPVHTAPEREEVDTLRDLLLTHVVEPQLGRGRVTLLYDYPASQAALARIRPDTPPVAERFEAYLDGIELANGFHELLDAGEQRARFARDLAKRKQQGLPAVPMDERLLAALEHGLPECSGVALGFDRLVMLAAGAHSLAAVLPFSVDRA